MDLLKSLRKITGVMTFGEKLRYLRDQKKMLQEELATTLNKVQTKTKFTRHMIAKWETDMDLPRMDRLLALSNYFGKTVDELIRPEIKLKNATKKIASKSKIKI